MRRAPSITSATLAAAVTAALATALAGCAVGPNFHTPAAPKVQTYGATPEAAETVGGRGPQDTPQRLDRGAAVDAAWWRAFGSPELDGLMDQALAHNADLATAKAALRQAREMWLAQRGALLPTIDLQGQAQRARESQTLSPVLFNNAAIYNLYSTQLNVGYTLDLFGGVRRSVEAARAQAEQQRFQSEAAYLTLTANVANAYVQLAALHEQLRLTEQLVAADRQVLALTQLQHDSGQVSGVELAQAVSQLAQAENGLPMLAKQIAAQQDMLAALTGRAPAELGALQAPFAGLSLPAELPLSAPAQMVRQRPDLRAAEEGVHAAAAQVGVAIANRLPNISLAAAAGGISTQIGSVLASPSQLWTIGGGIAQPVFEGGTLMHRQRGAQAALDQAQAQYRSTLLTALQNVADTLAAIQADAEALKVEEAAEQAGVRGVQLTELQHRYGQVSELSAATARASQLQASVTRVQGVAARLGDSVALFVALGGGWWERHDF